ncbi:MAG: polysaccharide deacetylase family protein [Planctomycetota bacterium]
MKVRYVFAKTHNILKLQRNIQQRLCNHSEGVVKVLIYHDIPESRLGKFHDQIKALYDNYIFITPNQFHFFMAGNCNLRGLNLLLTFDDGFLSSRTAAEEVLGPLGIKALFFVTVNFVGISDEQQWKHFVSDKICGGTEHVQNFKPEYMPMGWQDIFWLRDNGHTIGSHTLSHPGLSFRLTENVLASEIIQSGDILEEKLDTAIDDFAYPFGNIESISPQAIAQIQKRYKYCFSGIRGLNRPLTHPMGIFRDSVNLDDTIDYLKFQVENGLSWLYYRKSRKLQSLINEARVG